MQTFLPYPDFLRSAECLDYRRLGKQRIETKQIWLTLMGQGKGSGWKNHPAVLMWKGYEDALIWYGEIMCREWIKRGYNDTTLPWIMAIKSERVKVRKTIPMPPWLGVKAFHSAHRQTLLSKDLTHYGQFGWTEVPKYEYWWPTKQV